MRHKESSSVVRLGPPPVLEKFLKDYRKEVPFIDEDIIMYTGNTSYGGVYS